MGAGAARIYFARSRACVMVGESDSSKRIAKPQSIGPATARSERATSRAENHLKSVRWLGDHAKSRADAVAARGRGHRAAVLHSSRLGDAPVELMMADDPDVTIREWEVGLSTEDLLASAAPPGQQQRQQQQQQQREQQRQQQQQ